MQIISSPLDKEIGHLKFKIKDMFELAMLQFGKSIHALVHFDKDTAKEVIMYEKRINSLELKIDRDCEEFVALYNPVAIDLRFVFATFKINSHIERLGDNAKGIARFVKDLKEKFDVQLLEDLQIKKMMSLGLEMMKLNIEAFQNEDTTLAKKIFELDYEIDQLNNAATYIIAEFMRKNPEQIEACLSLISTVRKMERVGDLNLNIAEEIIFYIDAKVLKHSKELKVK